jgi:hypothetical protein
MKWAKKYDIQLITLKPQYDIYSYKVAPLMRNTDIIAAATHLLAFPSYSRGRGTQDAIKKAHGIIVEIVDLDSIK